MNEKIRLIRADRKKCIGCRACTSVCPEGRIHFSEEESMRHILFPESCTLDCELCALACPEKAIIFVLREEGIEENTEVSMDTNTEGELRVTGKKPGEKEREGENLFLSSDRTVSLELVPCRKCGTTFATFREIEKVRKSISEKVPLFSGGDLWIEFCPGCRRVNFREKEAETLLRTRCL